MKLKSILVITFLCNYIYAQLPDNINLEADNIIYSKKENLLQATSNVVLTYENLNIYTDHFTFNTKTSEVDFKKPFKLTNQRQTAVGHSLHYNYKTNNGYATNISIKSDTINLKSEKLVISPIKITLYNTLISNCNLEKKHMVISSKKIDVYPLIGLVYAKNNWLTLNFLPFKIPLPIIPYGSTKHSLLGNNQYLPEFGQNSIMGSYAIYKSNYIINKHLSGTVDIGYTKNLTWMAGGSNTLYQNKYISQAIRYHYYAIINDTSLYAITNLNLNYKKHDKQNHTILDKLLTPFTTKTTLNNSKLKIILQKKDIQYNYWIDHLPKIELSLPKLSIGSTHINTLLSTSKTTESNNNHHLTTSKHIHLTTSIKKSFPLLKKTNITPEINLNTNSYDNNKQWNRLFFITKIKFKMFLNPEISYLQKIIRNGKSPFQYEQQYALTNNEIGINISETTKKVTLSYESFFTLKHQNFRKQTLLFLYKFHCWGIGFNWKINEKEFSLQFSLN